MLDDNIKALAKGANYAVITHIDALSMKYVGHPYANPIGTERLIVKVRPKRQKFLNGT